VPQVLQGITIAGGTVQMMRNLVASAWLGRLDEPGL
jgi:hypothetical protein